MSAYQYSEIELKLRAECENGFTVGQGTSMYLAVTGEPYVELCGGTIKAETESVTWQPTIEAAYEASMAAFREYAKDKTGAIYWRVYPELGNDRNRWAFYMRLLVSDKPVLCKSDERVKSYWAEAVA